jgi:hypothetical protein
MNKKQADRRPDEKPADQGPGKHDPSKPESGRRMPEVREDDQELGKPGGHPIDKQIPKPGTRGGGGNDILDGDRSDRESGRPIQLEDDGGWSFPPGQPGQADSEPGGGGRPQEDREGRKPYEAKIKR